VVKKTNSVGKETSIRSDTVTFRIHHSLLEELRKESKHKSESLNTLVNQIINTYINYHKPLYKCGYIYFSKALLARVFNSIDNEQLGKLADDHVKNELKEHLNMLGLQYNLQSFLDGVFVWCEESGFPYRYDEINDADIYTVRFDLGPKWSVFFAKETRVILNDLIIRDTEVEVTNNTVIMKFKNKRETNPKWIVS
jgi:hypothetical protein